MTPGPSESGDRQGEADAERPGIYVHIPFCSAICPYCDFAVARGAGAERARLVSAVVAEIAQCHGGRQKHGLESISDPAPQHLAGKTFDAESFDTVYFGGGTPSILEVEQLATVVDELRRSFSLTADVELSLEANPEDVSAASLAEWTSVGFSRISLGVQALDDQELRFLGRRHRAAQARRAIELACASSFRQVSVDLIYGLPDQEPRAWARSLAEVVSLGPQHLSCYELTVHAGTPFARLAERGELHLDESLRAELFLLTHRRLGELGMPGYEVSNFAKEESVRSRHNQKYWFGASYLGIGPSAHSFDGRRRWWNQRDWRGYAERVESGHSPIAEDEELDDSQLALESLSLSLRTVEGLDLERYRARFGEDLERTRAAELAVLITGGLLVQEENHLRPTLRGLALADEVARRLV